MKKIRKYEIYSVALVLFLSLFVLNNIYAQDDPNLLDGSRTMDEPKTTDETKTLDGDTTKTEPAGDTNDPEPVLISTDSDTTKDEPSNDDLDIITDDKTLEEEAEAIGDIAEAVDDIRTSADDTEAQLRDAVKTGIDRNIIDIRKETDIKAYELQKAVDDDRLDLFENIDTTLGNINLDDDVNLDNFAQEIEDQITNIENALEERSGLEATFEEERLTIRNIFEKLQNDIDDKKQIIEEREGDQIYEDTDGDGVSDYDERFIYNSDPNSESTSGDGASDAEKISNGINPRTNEPINYSDPRDDVESYITSAYKLETVALVKQDGKDKMLFEGRALPNSFVTLYIYSTPIIVTVRTDEYGDWVYELDKELENGEHELYVATVNNSGKIIARSNAIAFTKTAEAATIGIVGVEVETSKAGDFFRDNFILIALALLIVIVIITLMLAGKKTSVADVVSDLKKEVEEPESTNK